MRAAPTACSPWTKRVKAADPQQGGVRFPFKHERDFRHIKSDRQRDQDGRPYRSFRGLLAHLGTLTRNQVRFAGAPAEIPVLTEPTSEQSQAFDLIGAQIPLTLKK